MGDWKEPRDTNIVGDKKKNAEGNKDFSDCMPPKPKDKSSLKHQVCGPVKHEGKPCLALFRENTGGLHPALSDNAGRLIIRQEPAFLSDEVEVTAGQNERTALTRDVSLYQTYAYFVTNTGGGIAEVALRANGTHDFSNAIIGPGMTVILTPKEFLPYPLFDDLVEVTYIAIEETPTLRIRFTGQLAGALHGLPCAPFAWGDNGAGQLGDSSIANDRLRPVQTLRLAGVKALAGGNAFSTGLLTDGTVWSWGDNSSGQLGDGTESDLNRLVPGQVRGLSSIAAIASGDRFSLALRTDGRVFAWGSNVSGQIGDGATGDDRPAPVQVLGVGGVGFLGNIKSIAAGDNHSVARDSTGFVFAWGGNGSGQLGNNDAPNGSPVPVRVLGVGGVGLLNGIVSVSAGDGHSVALSQDGRVFAWGNNSDGQLGNNNMPNDSPVPVQVLGVGGTGFLTGVKAVAAGEFFNLALLSDGTVVAWGDNNEGQLGNNNAPNDSPVPVQVLGVGGQGILRNIVALAGGNRHSLALSADGQVYAWGDNSDGQLGDGNLIQGNVPVLVGTLTDVVAIGAGSFHSLAVVR